MKLIDFYHINFAKLEHLKNMFRIIINTMVGLNVAVLSSSALAQVSENYKNELLSKGFVTTDLKSAQITQINPHFRFYKKWERCSIDAADIIIMNKRSASDSYSFALSSCNSEALELQASVGASVGLPKAKKIMNTLNAGLEIFAEQKWKSEISGVSSGIRQIGEWYIQGTSSGCVMFTINNGQAGPVSFGKVNSDISMLLKTNNPQASIGSVTAARVIVGHYPEPTQISSQFTVVQSKGITAIKGIINSKDLDFIEHSSTIIIKSPGSEGVYGRGRDERIELNDTLQSALRALRRC